MAKKNKVDNWRDERGSGLEKAKKLITDKNVDLVAVSKKVNIPYHTLRDYRQNFSKLKKARWEQINKLSRLVDSLYVQDSMDVQDSMFDVDSDKSNFERYLNDLFHGLAEVEDEDDVPVINRLHDIVISDLLLEIELYKAKGLKKGDMTSGCAYFMGKDV